MTNHDKCRLTKINKSFWKNVFEKYFFYTFYGQSDACFWPGRDANVPEIRLRWPTGRHTDFVYRDQPKNKSFVFYWKVDFYWKYCFWIFKNRKFRFRPICAVRVPRGSSDRLGGTPKAAGCLLAVTGGTGPIAKDFGLFWNDQYRLF